MATKKRGRKAENPYLSTDDPEGLGPADRMAYDLAGERRDLLPSVQRIMDAGLGEEATVRAMTLFRESLDTVGDPHRDPRVAIARCEASA